MRTIYLVAVSFLLFVAGARAETGTLVEHVPGGADPAIVIAVVKQALLNREWTIRSIEPAAVDAEIDHAQVNAKIRVVFSQGRLLYEGTAIRTFPPAQQMPPTKRKSRVPKDWLAYLRRDISNALATMPENR